MITNDPAGIAGALGLIDDAMEELLVPYGEAAAALAEFEHWHRTMFLAKKQELQAVGAWTAGTTETQKKDEVEHELRKEYAPYYAQIKELAATKAKGDVMFKGLDARRSIGQTLMNMHKAADRGAGFGQGHTPQGGTS